MKIKGGSDDNELDIILDNGKSLFDEIKDVAVTGITISILPNQKIKARIDLVCFDFETDIALLDLIFKDDNLNLIEKHHYNKEQK